jgi:hypothetical protein
MLMMGGLREKKRIKALKYHRVTKKRRRGVPQGLARSSLMAPAREMRCLPRIRLLISLRGSLKEGIDQ